MDSAKQHWKILQRLGTNLANRVREFMVTGRDGEGLLLVMDNGLGFWLGKLEFGLRETRTANKLIPLNIPELVSMAHCGSHLLLLNKRGMIYSMGRNNEGQLGLGTVDKNVRFSPQLISIPQHKFISVRCGDWHSLALTDDGKCWAWGSNCSGQLGVPSSYYNLSSPSQIVELDPHRIVAIECGGHHSLALTDRGEVYAWGRNDWGQVGDESLTFQLAPTRIPTPSPVQSMAAGSNHTLLLTQTGEVYACGGNRWGQLGRPGTNINLGSDLSKVLGLPPISQIASHPATDLSIAMTSYHQCFVWGELGNVTSTSTPRKLPLTYSTVDCPFSSSSSYRSTPHSVSIPETPTSRLTIQMSRIFDNPEFCDVQFVVEQRTIHAHRVILSKSSDYFARMFSEKWLAPEDLIVEVTIPDHTYSAFHAFLRFLYTDSLEVHYDLLPEMFDLASQYLIPELQNLCISRMRTTLTPTTCCLYYPLTHRHSLLPELATFQQELVQFASTRMSEVTNSAAFHLMESDLRDQLTNAIQNFPGA